MGDVAVRLPPLEEIALAWPEIEPMLRRVTDVVDVYQPIDVLRAAFLGAMGIWLVEQEGELKVVIVTEIRQFPRRRVLDCPLICGDAFDGWHIPALAALEAHARSLGCCAITGLGSRGWSKLGFKEMGTVWARLLPLQPPEPQPSAALDPIPERTEQ